ncbi:MAG TPA: iron-sulfur cluster-binding domain-containing protein [Syntrophomonas sp.]|jgi:ferredoxin-NADP reductase|nr:iron-sulfur cluster-binding domain-containing protein [Syntrophomonas sp.]
MDYRKFIDGYDRIQQEIEICEKYGHDYRTEEKGRTAALVANIHPGQLRLKLTEVIDETPEVKTLRWADADGRQLPPFQAGQYLSLKLTLDGVHTTRPYSISSSPRQRAYYDITVRSIPGGLVSSYLLGLKPGAVVTSGGPEGHFVYNPVFHGKKLAMIAGGSGVTPFMSMIREVCQAGLEREITLIYGAKSAGDLIFAAELKAYNDKCSNFTFIPVIEDAVGVIDGAAIKNALDVGHVSMFYLCGPQGMYGAVKKALAAAGVPNRKIRQEMSGTADDPSVYPQWPAEIALDQEFAVKVANQIIPAKAGEPLLKALEKAGLKVPSSCRCGECSYCRVKIISGTVFEPETSLVRMSDCQYGYVHSCQAFPTSDLEILL